MAPSDEDLSAFLEAQAEQERLRVEIEAWKQDPDLSEGERIDLIYAVSNHMTGQLCLSVYHGAT